MGNEPEKLNFNVGDEVFLFQHSYSNNDSERARLTVVEKVYKNTRFTLRNSVRQFKQNGHQAGRSMTPSRVELATPDMKYKVEAAKRFSNRRREARLALNKAVAALHDMKTVEDIDAYMSQIWEVK